MGDWVGLFYLEYIDVNGSEIVSNKLINTISYEI
jgi:hypothetical protein